MWCRNLHRCPRLCLRLFFLFSLTLHPGEPQKHLHGDERRHGARALHRGAQRVPEVRVETLLVVSGQAHAREPSAFGVALRLLHQSPAVAPPSLGAGHHHRLHEQAAGVTHDPGQPGVAEQPLRLPEAAQEHQADGEVRTGLPEGVDPGGPAAPPLGVHQVGAGNQQVGTLVYRNRTDLLRLFGVSGKLPLGFPTQRRDVTGSLGALRGTSSCGARGEAQLAISLRMGNR